MVDTLLTKTITSSHPISQKTLSKTLRYLYIDQNDVGSVDEENHFVDLRILGIGRGAEIGAGIAFELRERPYALVYDHAGHVKALIDASTGELHESYRYSAFGEETLYNRNHQPINPNQSINPFRFSSKRIDPETGWVFFGRRYYDPSLGRFMTPDPLGFAAGPNLYAYVNNAPLTHIDLYGLYTCPICGREHQTRANRHGSRAQHRDDSRTRARQEEHRTSKKGLSPVDTAIKVARTAGKIIESIGRHTVPFPYVRQAIITMGCWMQGHWVGPTEATNEPPSGIFRYTPSGYDSRVPSTEQIVHTNGMLTTFNDMKERGQQLADAYNSPVSMIFVSTNGFICDFIKCSLNMIGVQTRSACILAKHLTDQCRQGTKSHLLAFSRGGLVIKASIRSLSQEVRNNTTVLTCGSAYMVPKDVFKEATNYVSNGDGVPHLCDPIEMMKNDNIVRLPGASFFPLDHSWDSPSYQEVVFKDAQEFRKRN